MPVRIAVEVGQPDLLAQVDVVDVPSAPKTRQLLLCGIHKGPYFADAHLHVLVALSARAVQTDN